MQKRFLPLLLILSLLTCCHKVPDQIEPTVSYTIQDKYLKSLPSPFPPLTPQERSQDFGKEYLIGLSFAQKLDLYQAITAFKRAQILIDPTNRSRLLEIDYEILLCYYVGRKYHEVIDTFEQTQLHTVTPDFPAFHDLLIILQSSYMEVGNEQGVERITRLLQEYYPDTANKIVLGSALLAADFQTIRNFEAVEPYSGYLTPLLSSYDTQKKSVGTAQGLNALLPGAGYLYLGQKQSAITAFLLNGLFITAATYFFEQGNIAAGVIFTSFEAGWYFGGIYGAGLEAKYYNERLYEKTASPVMQKEGLFPILMLRYAF